MTAAQFKVLYREFLFRVIDVEFISPHGDANKLLGQFAAALFVLGSMFAIGAVGLDGVRVPREVLLVQAWGLEHALISTTMLVVGLLGILSWESIFPDRQDVLVLGPLPVLPRTLFLAKVTALMSALACAVFTLNALPGLALPFAISPHGRNILDLLIQPDLYRSYAAYWLTMIVAGLFILCLMLCVQGLAMQLLPRRLFLRASAILQMSVFCLLICVYVLQPNLTTPVALSAAKNQEALTWLPSYWFLAVFQHLNSSMHPVMAPFAVKAWAGLAIVVTGSCILYFLSYVRIIRQTVEMPDIVPASRGRKWSPNLGNSLQTAIALFSFRTLARGRQHRVTLAFYLGVAFAIAILYLKTPAAQRQLLSEANIPLMFSSAIMMIACVVGIRVIFSIPLALKANWIFRITEVRGVDAYFAAIRSSLFLLALTPVWIASSLLFFSIWPWPKAAGHLIFLGLGGVILTYLCLHHFHKIPFTCSFLPGKIPLHFVLLASPMFLLILSAAIKYEYQTLNDPIRYLVIVAMLSLTAIFVRWRTLAQAVSNDAVIQFDESPSPEVQELGLHRDGISLTSTI